MGKTIKEYNGNTSGEFISFYIGDALCGISILRVQEIIKFPNFITHTPLAPEYIFGLLNLRGQLITVIDIGKKLGSLQGKLFKSVYKTDARLIGILDVDEILKYQ